MANRFPLILDTADSNKIKELPSGDNLDLTGSGISAVGNITGTGTVTSKDIRMTGYTTSERDALTAAEGQLIYNTSNDKFQGYAGGAWQSFQGIDYTDLSVTTAAASGGGALSYNNNTGTFTFTPAATAAQTLSLSGTTLTISGGNQVALGSIAKSSFVELNDTPANFTGSAGYFVRVNSAGDALHFVADPGYVTTIAFDDLTSTPTTIAGYGITDAFDGAYSSLTGAPTIPSATSDLTNDSGFITAAEVPQTFGFSVGADDSTMRGIGSGEGFQILGGTAITTTSDAEGNITITNDNFGADITVDLFAQDSTKIIDHVENTITTGQVNVGNIIMDSVNSGDRQIGFRTSDSSSIAFNDPVNFEGNVDINSDIEFRAGVEFLAGARATFSSEVDFRKDILAKGGISRKYADLTAGADIDVDLRNGFFELDSLTQDFNINLTNIGMRDTSSPWSTDDIFGKEFVIYINQGSTPYVPTTFTIQTQNGKSSFGAIRWQGSAPTGTANGYDKFTFDLRNYAENSDNEEYILYGDWAGKDINQLVNVDVTSPQTGQVLKWNGSAWTNDVDSEGSGGGGGGGLGYIQIGADDSSLRIVNDGEAFLIKGAQNVTTASDAEGNITITGPDLSTYLEDGDSFNVTGDLTGSVFADDSTLLVDGTNGTFPGITGTDLDMGGNKVLFGNVYTAIGDLPSASTYHGMFAHVHSTGKGYFAHAGNWVALQNESDAFDGAYGSLTGTPTIPSDVNELTDVDGLLGGSDPDGTGEEYSFKIGADDSTARVVDNGEQINITGGTGISTSSDAEGNITITATGSSNTGDITFSGTTLDSNDSSGIEFTPAVTFNSDITVENDIVCSNVVYAESFQATGAGTPTITSDSSITLSAQDRVSITRGPLKHATFTTTERDALTSVAGDTIFNTTTNDLEVYNGSSWDSVATGTFLADLVSDTSPQLGGDLDVNSNTLSYTFNVTASGSSDYTLVDPGNKFFPSSETDPVLYLRRGETYNFVVNASSHPFEIRASNGGSAYNTGVTNNGTGSGTVVFTVPMSAPATLYYQCTVHSAMGNTINIV